MKIKLGKSILTSKKYDINIYNKFRNKIKRKLKQSKTQQPTIHNHKITQNPFIEKPKKIIEVPINIQFSNDIDKIINLLNKIKHYQKNYQIIIDHSKMEIIDNTSILLITAGVNSIFDNRKLRKSKKYAPKKDIDEKLGAIGYWNALCFNSKSMKDNLDYLRIRSDSGETIDNELHENIVNYFAKKDKIIELYKDTLFDAIYEAMANAKEHAYRDKDKKIWLLGSYQNNIIEFVFYDIGQGIFESLAENNGNFARMLRKFAGIFGKDKTLQKLCTTNLSKYKDKRRGVGMITFKKFVDLVEREKGYSAILEVVTSNLMFSSKNGVSKIKKDIQGTLIRWVIIVGERNE